MSKIIGITGWKDVGKTYYASLIIKSLVNKGYQVGSIKREIMGIFYLSI